MGFFKWICRCIGRAERMGGQGRVLVALLLVLVVFMDVVMRYAFRTSFVFTQELE